MENSIELSKTRCVTVGKYHKQTLINIREYYEKDGQKLPSSKGISLTVDQWNLLKDNFQNIDGQIEKINKN